MKIDNLKLRAMIMAAVAILVTAGSAAATTLSFTPDNPMFSGPDLQTIQVVVDEVDDLLAASFVVGFDPAVVTPVAVTPGDLISDGGCAYFLDWLNNDDFIDTIEVDAAMLGCTTAGGGVLLNITFAGVGSGTSALNLIEVDFRDGVNGPIPTILEEGAVTYLTEISANLNFRPEFVLFEEDGTTEICLNLEGVEDFLSMTVEFSFDPAVISPLSISAGTALQNAGCLYYLDWLNFGNFLNTMELDLALLGCTATMDGPTICVIFQGIGFGESPLTWLNVELRDSNNQSIPINTFDGVVMYNSAVDNTPITLDGLKSLYGK